MKLHRRHFFQSLIALAARLRGAAAGRKIFVVPNFHPASCGWLTNFAKERVYCANSYFDHLDRVRDDPQYAFALSEVNNIIAMLNFHPERKEELALRIKEGRVELVNAFFLESTINLSGGEALVRLGVEGLRWQKQVFGVRPRIAWTIDVCGTHDQMAQIASGLGLEAMVYTRKNPTGSTMHWAESPDGSRILALCPGHYSEFGEVMRAKELLNEKQLAGLERYFEQKEKTTPAGAPILVLAGSGDYALAPVRPDYPSAFLKQWKETRPDDEMRFTTPSRYLDAVLPAVKSGKIKLPTMKGGTEYDFNSFWIQNPRVKIWYRRSEHSLQAAEMLATIASLQARFDYPVEALHHAWIRMCLNMDRNTLWGAAGGMVFEHEKSWDVRDRFQAVESVSAKTVESAGRSLASGDGKSAVLFNPLNWKRNDPFVLGSVVCQTELPSVGIAGWRQTSNSGQVRDLPHLIETKQYRARIDPKSGALVSLQLKPSGREVLGGSANVIVAEKPQTQIGNPGDHMVPRPERLRLGSSNQSEAKIKATEDPLGTTVEIEGMFFGGGLCRRTMRFHNDYPRVDFETELNDIPDRTVVVAEFPLAESIAEVRRGIPYGFSHGAWDRPNPELHGWAQGIVPSVRWSHYEFTSGGGFAIFDRGLSGRELNGATPLLYLLNASVKYNGYPNSWLSGQGKHRLAYALVAHEGGWKQARIPRMAWEYNCPPVLIPGAEDAPARSFLETSDNVIVEAMRRETGFIELRMVECYGEAGTAEVRLALPHKQVFLTDLTGANPRPLVGGPRYRFPIRPQQIVTVRFATDSAVAGVKPVMAWDELVPANKRATLHEYSSDKGHPPRGN